MGMAGFWKLEKQIYGAQGITSLYLKLVTAHFNTSVALTLSSLVDFTVNLFNSFTVIDMKMTNC